MAVVSRALAVMWCEMQAGITLVMPCIAPGTSSSSTMWTVALGRVAPPARSGAAGSLLQPKCLLAGSVLLLSSLALQAPAGQTDFAAMVDPALIDGPAAPVPPEVMTRDEQGRATVRAVRLDESIDLDGLLDEAVYETVPAISGFIQLTPGRGSGGDREDRSVDPV